MSCLVVFYYSVDQFYDRGLIWRDRFSLCPACKKVRILQNEIDIFSNYFSTDINFVVPTSMGFRNSAGYMGADPSCLHTHCVCLTADVHT